MKFTTDDLQFDDDEATEFGAAPDFDLSFDSGNDRLELVDRVNNAVSHIQRDRAGGLVSGRFSQAVAEGKVLADDGVVYDTIQAAENAAGSWIKIGPGRFDEQVTVSTAGLDIVGSGNKTIVYSHDGGAETMRVTAKRVEVRNLSLTGGDSSAQGALQFEGAEGVARNLRVFDTNNTRGLGSRKADVAFINNRVINTGTSGIVTTGNRNLMIGNIIIDSASQGIYGDSDIVIANNVLIGCGEDGIDNGGDDDQVIIGNRVHNVTSHGINIGGNDNIVADNRVSDSGGNDINDNGSNTTKDGNITGTAN